MVIVMLVIMTETTADILAIGEVIDRPADCTVVGGLRADTLATTISGGLLNGFPVSAFAQNVGLVAITGIKSRFVVAVSGIILVALGLVPKLGAIIASIPLPVLVAGSALFGTVAASGIRALSRVDYDGTSNLIIVAVSIAMGVLPIASPTFYEHFPSWFQTIFDSGISAAALTAVLLNLLFNGMRRDAEAPIAAEGPAPGRHSRRGRARRTRAVTGLAASRRSAWMGRGVGADLAGGQAERDEALGEVRRRRSRRRRRARRCGRAPPRPARPCRRSPGR